MKGDDSVDEVKRHEIDDEVRVVVQASKWQKLQLNVTGVGFRAGMEAPFHAWHCQEDIEHIAKLLAEANPHTFARAGFVRGCRNTVHNLRWLLVGYDVGWGARLSYTDK